MVPVDDFGIEVLKKAAEPVTPGSKDDYYIKVSNNKEVPNSAYVAGNVSVGTTEVQAKVGSGNLAGRIMITIANYSDSSIWYGPSGVTTTSGVRIPKKGDRTILAGPGIDIYLIRELGTGDVHVQEFA